MPSPTSGKACNSTTGHNPANAPLKWQTSYPLYILENSDTSFVHPGDMVLVEKGGRPKPNDIVIAQVDDDWTLKYYGKDSEGVYLDPANSRYKSGSAPGSR